MWDRSHGIVVTKGTRFTVLQDLSINLASLSLDSIG